MIIAEKALHLKILQSRKKKQCCLQTSRFRPPMYLLEAADLQARSASLCLEKYEI